jgi:release factor glutamine methyltransferase
VRDHDPKSALDGGADGLDFYRTLAGNAQSHLVGSGRLMLEFGEGQAESIKKIFEEQKWIVEAIERDYNQRERILVARFPK